MADAQSAPPVLKGTSFFVHHSFPLQQKRFLKARIKFFSGEILDTIADARYVLLATNTPIEGLSREVIARVRDTEWLEDFLKEKLGKEFSTYLDLPIIKEPHRVSDFDGVIPVTAKPMRRVKKRQILSPESSPPPDHEKRIGGLKNAIKEEVSNRPKTLRLTAQSGHPQEAHSTSSPKRADSETESSGKENSHNVPLKCLENQIKKPVQQPPERTRSVTGFAFWRKRPRVLLWPTVYPDT